jgi:uncharacterized protein (TIGR02118 family)
VLAASIYRMVRFLVLYNTPLDAAEFDRHYREVHIPLASTMPGLRRYSISRSPAPIHGEAYYLIAELDWDDMESMQQAFASPEGQAAAADVPTFATGGAASMIYEIEDLV